MKQRFVVILEIDSTTVYTRDDLPDWIEEGMERGAGEDLAGIHALVFDSADDLVRDAWDQNGMGSNA